MGRFLGYFFATIYRHSLGGDTGLRHRLIVTSTTSGSGRTC